MKILTQCCLLGRAGWCPGGAVKPWVVDITKGVKPGLEALVTYKGLYNGSDFIPAPCWGGDCNSNGVPPVIEMQVRGSFSGAAIWCCACMCCHADMRITKTIVAVFWSLNWRSFNHARAPLLMRENHKETRLSTSLSHLVSGLICFLLCIAISLPAKSQALLLRERW